LKRTWILATAVVAALTFSAIEIADAKRLSGGRSLGTQRQSVAPPAATPPAAPATVPGGAANPVMPAQPGAAMAKQAAPAATAAAAKTGMSRWMGPLVGLAAGLGIAALLSHFGLSEAFAGFLMLALIAVAVVVALRFLLARRAAPTRQPLQYAGPAGLGNAPGGYETQAPPTWGGAAPKADAPVMPGTAPAATVAAATARPLPPDFDAAGFVNQAKLQFRKLQAAYDSGDRAALADVMTAEMLAEIGRDFDSRGGHVASEVVSVDGQVLEVTTEGDRHWASVRLYGLMREDGAAQPVPFDEVWHLSKPVSGRTGWLLSGIQQLEQA
jgi:predicted lipid-binding transport protein (Tim44 family)